MASGERAACLHAMSSLGSTTTGKGVIKCTYRRALSTLHSVAYARNPIRAGPPCDAHSYCGQV